MGLYPHRGEPAPVIVVCGPTASGKSAVADEISGRLSMTSGVAAITLVVDSMQVYREIPRISNQARTGPAELASVVSVTEEWTVARHRAAVDAFLSDTDNTSTHQRRFVLDAGTGMYLNAILMDIELAPRVDAAVRAEAIRQTTDDTGGPVGTPARRRARSRELEITGAPARGSIWTREMRMDADILYLRPPRNRTDAAIEARSNEISRGGIPEARELMKLAEEGNPPTPQVMGSIGVRELMQILVHGGASEGALEDARRRISTRTRRLARRQVRWFDKMVRTLEESAAVTVAEGPDDPRARDFIERSIRDAQPAPPLGTSTPW